MNKIAVIALTEIQSFVQTKAFLVSLVLMPLLMFGGAAGESFLTGMDARTRSFTVIDHSGSLYGAIARAASERDREIAGDSGLHHRARFVPSQLNVGDPTTDEARLKLSDEIRKEGSFAFVEIPEGAAAASAQPTRIAYYSDSPTNDALRDWLTQVLAKEIRAQRYHGAGVAPDVVLTIERPVLADNLGLFERGPDGTIRAAPPIDGLRLVLVPAVAVGVMFLLVLMGAPQLLNAVLEEKMSRISEVLIGSVAPFELMMGKLVGSAAVSLLTAALYVGGGLALAAHLGLTGLVSPAMLGWFALFLVLATLLYGSLSLAVGSACSTLKEAQSLYMPIMLMSTLPIFLVSAVIESPSSSLAVGASLFPPATPFLMILRLGLHPAPPGWQVALSVLLTLAATWASVWAASRVFRVGLLLQGKAPSLLQLASWVFADP